MKNICSIENNSDELKIMLLNQNRFNSTTLSHLFHKMHANIRNSPSEFGNEMEWMRSLTEEIRGGIFNLSSGEFDNTVWENDVQTIIERSGSEQYADAVVNLLLFRKYADVANNIKSKNQNHQSVELIAFDPSVSVLHDTIEDKLACTLNFGVIFWLRVFTTVLALTSMIVMASIPGIAKHSLCPVRTFEYGCRYSYDPYDESDASCFPNKSYHLIIATVAILIPYNLFFAWYSLLPTTDNGKKFVPGCCVLIGIPSYTAPLFDILLLHLPFVAGICGSLALQTEKHIELYTKYHSKSYSKEGFYTIASFYAEFANMGSSYNPCLKASDDPSPRMFASIVSMYFTACFMTLCFAVSFYHYWKSVQQAKYQENQEHIAINAEEIIPTAQLVNVLHYNPVNNDIFYV